MRYVVLVDGEAGVYGVTVPDLPGCTSGGATVDEALSNAVEAVAMWVEEVERQGRTAPAPRPIEVLRTDPDVAAALAEGAILGSVPLVRETARPVKANLSLDAGVLAAIDAEAARRKLTRSALVEWMAKRVLATG